MEVEMRHHKCRPIGCKVCKAAYFEAIAAPAVSDDLAREYAAELATLDPDCGPTYWNGGAE